MKILGLDIETTGLSGDKNKKNNSDLLEIGLVMYDTDLHKDLSFDELNSLVPKIRIIVHRPTKYLQGGFFAFNMHKDTLLPLHLALDIENKEDILEELVSGSSFNEYTYIIKENEVIETFMKILKIFSWISKDNYNAYLEGEVKGVKDALTVAGKNVGTFDIPYLRDYITGFGSVIKTRTRVFDPTVFFADFDSDCLPDLQECLNKARTYEGFPVSEVKHTAVEDAMDVINLIHLTIKENLYHK